MGEKKTQFRVSSSLKSIVGRDLITDQFAAVFELVKNSIDAHAKRVDVVFDLESEDPAIWIVDNGKGMSVDDIQDKWLFLGYSAKKEGEEDRSTRLYAGNKGVGRFSCDRLGSRLKVYGRTRNSKSVNLVRVDWDDFEVNSKKEFVEVDVYQSQQKEFALPEEVDSLKQGVVIEIRGVREVDTWDRKRLLKLKRDLAKLVNPFGGQKQRTGIFLHCKSERELDALDKEQSAHSVVNGSVRNDILDVLESKTTRFTAELTPEGALITELVDRGDLIYRVKEVEGQNFVPLKGSRFKAEIYYLNQAAKLTFSRRMGVLSRDFGSVFLYRNDFQVLPVGEPNDDYWGLDRRKTQGYSRFLGNRDVMGRIDVIGDESKFKESSSRDKGLIDTKESVALKEMVMSLIKRFERYVVGVSWQDKPDKHESDSKRLYLDESKARVIELISGLAEDESLEILSYNSDLVSLLSKKSSQYEAVLNPLRVVVDKLGDAKLEKSIRAAERVIKKAKSEQAEALRYAEDQARKKEELEQEAESLRQGLEDEKKSAEELYTQNLFLKSMVSSDVDNLVGLHHHIRIAAGTISNYVSGVSRRIKKGRPMTSEMFLDIINKISMQANQIWSATRFATKANFKLEASILEGADVVMFVKEHVLNICDGVVKTEAGEDMEFVWENIGATLPKAFRPFEVAVLVDTIINNSKKAGATTVVVNASMTEEEVRISISDNGRGVAGKDVDSIFDLGFTTTVDGSGFGLHHAKEIAGKLDGVITFENPDSGGAKFVISIKK